MAWLGAIVGAVLIGAVLIDAFEVVLLPRRVRHGFRLARLFYRWTWQGGRAASALLPAGRRSGLLSGFGPLSVFGLVVVWVVGLIVGFALLHWSLDTASAGAQGDLGRYLYFSATTFFTLGDGGLVPRGGAGRGLMVVEAGLGYIFLAVIISYLPVLYQAFSRREITISLLDARAGSPPTAGEFLRRLGAGGGGSFQNILVEWERWAAELLESHISFPMLSYYRSQHDNQSWVGALTTILDTSALLLTCVDGPDRCQARLTFAMARHATVDVALVFSTPPRPPQPDRLPEDDFARLQESLRGAGLSVRDGPAAVKALAEVRLLYEPFINALAIYFQFPLPTFLPAKPPVDNWQTSAWMPRSPSFGNLPAAGADEHFN